QEISSRQIPFVTYDLRRRSTLLLGGYIPPSTYLTDSWTFDGNTWTQLASAGPAVNTFQNALVYRPTDGPALVYDGVNTDWRDGATWTTPAGVGPLPRSIAWDARAATPIAVVVSGGQSQPSRLSPQGMWMPLTLLPQGVYRVLGDMRTGGVLMFDLGARTS